jgi:hypothetical protein
LIFSFSRAQSNIKKAQAAFKKRGLSEKEQEAAMVSKSIPKLLQEANEVKQALEKIGAGVPSGISVAEMMNRIAALVDAVNAVDALNAERTRLVNNKAEQAKNLSDYIVQVRAAVKGILGADSSEYDMVGGTRTSERKRPKRKAGGTE